jgi:PhnB protein
MIYVRNVDAAFARAIAAGAVIERLVEDQFYGDRNGAIVDPFGPRWTISTMSRTCPRAR